MLVEQLVRHRRHWWAGALLVHAAECQTFPQRDRRSFAAEKGLISMKRATLLYIASALFLVAGAMNTFRNSDVGTGVVWFALAVTFFALARREPKTPE